MGHAIEVEKTSKAYAPQAGGNRAAALAPSGVLPVIRAITVAALGARTTIYLVCHERESMPPLVWVSALALEFAVLSALLVKVAMSFYQAQRPARSVGSEHRLGPYTL